jgi:carboxypeptidase C (cathepsin A)
MRTVVLLVLVSLSLTLIIKNQKEREEIMKTVFKAGEPIQINTSCNDITIDSIDTTKHIKKSGYLNINKGKSNSSLYYMFYGARVETDVTKLSSYPILIWMNGGPGSSS